MLLALDIDYVDVESNGEFIVDDVAFQDEVNFDTFTVR